jgi:hypothetical protein
MKVICKCSLYMTMKRMFLSRETFFFYQKLLLTVVQFVFVGCHAYLEFE